MTHSATDRTVTVAFSDLARNIREIWALHRGITAIATEGETAISAASKEEWHDALMTSIDVMEQHTANLVNRADEFERILNINLRGDRV